MGIFSRGLSFFAQENRNFLQLVKIQIISFIPASLNAFGLLD